MLQRFEKPWVHIVDECKDLSLQAAEAQKQRDEALKTNRRIELEKEELQVRIFSSYILSY